MAVCGIAFAASSWSTVEGTPTAAASDVATYREHVRSETCASWQTAHLGKVDPTDQLAVTREIEQVDKIAASAKAIGESSPSLLWHLNIYSDLLDQHAPPASAADAVKLRRGLDTAADRIAVECR